MESRYIEHRDANRVLALVAAIAILAGPRRTRPVAGFLYGLFLSRGHGASRERLEATLARLFGERESAQRRLDAIEERLRPHSLQERTERLADVLRCSWADGLGGGVLTWEQLQESERRRWLDIAVAALVELGA